MQYLCTQITARAGTVVRVVLDRQANVRLLDPANYHRFQNGQDHRYYGGFAQSSPVLLKVPTAGPWYVVIDLGGRSGSIGYNVQVIQ